MNRRNIAHIMAEDGSLEKLAGRIIKATYENIGLDLDEVDDLDYIDMSEKVQDRLWFAIREVVKKLEEANR